MKFLHVLFVIFDITFTVTDVVQVCCVVPPAACNAAQIIDSNAETESDSEMSLACVQIP